MNTEKMGCRTSIRSKPSSDERRDQARRIRPWKRCEPLNPTQMAILMVVAVFVCETFSVYLLNFWGQGITGVSRSIIDSIILLVLLTPFYLFFYRPFWQEHQNFSREVEQLSRKLLKTVEDERMRISHDLHDQCGQTLTALQFGFEALRKGLPKSCLEGCPETAAQIKDLSKVLTQLGNEMREVTHRLRPDLLDQLGLVASLRDLISEFSQKHPQIEIKESLLVDEQVVQTLNSEIEVALYRICQECLNNISKYAQAPAVIVRLEKDNSSITLNMGDTGVGFNPRRKIKTGSNERQGIGLLGIRERVADLGGTFNLSTEVQKGTFITVKLPLSSGGKNE